MSERGSRDLLGEWTAAMQSLTETIGAAARSDVARQMVDPLQRQAELIQEVLEHERALQANLMQRAFAPFDAVFDLLQESGEAMRSQAEAVEDAAHSLERVAGLMKVQADLFERTVRTMREPAEVAKSLVGSKPAAKPDGEGQSRRRR